MNMRKLKDKALEAFTWIITSFGVGVLLVLLLFIFQNGKTVLSVDFLLSNYHKEMISGGLSDPLEHTFIDPEIDGYFISFLGIVIVDDQDKELHPVIVIKYIAPDSPLHALSNTNGNLLKTGLLLDTVIGRDQDGTRVIALSNQGASKFADALMQMKSIQTFSGNYPGGGIRGSIVSTVYLIVITLLIATPLGIVVAVYLNEFMKESKLKRIISSFIEMLSGIPSVVYGLFGLVFFVPFTMKIGNTNSGNLLAGALVLSVMLLPIIIKTTEESLKVVPEDLRLVSLGLGASKVQTILKVVLPSSIRGITSAVLLGIARIIGESAALIYVVGTVIKDQISIFGSSTTLSVHIWSIMGGETPNLSVASAISLIILVLVLLFSFTVKILLKQRRIQG